jgi:hypothetical protein
VTSTDARSRATFAARARRATVGAYDAMLGGSYTCTCDVAGY